MADKAEIALTFVNLVEGRLDPKQWADWLAANEAQVMPLLNPGQAMRFRLAANATPASVNGAPLRRLAAVQVQAIAVLKAWGIEATLDPTYGQLAQREFAATMKARLEKEKEAKAQRSTQISRFDARFPVFAAFLRRHSDQLDGIGEPSTENQLNDLCAKIGGPIPPALQQFLLCTSALRVGSFIDLDIELMGRIQFDHLPENNRPASHGMVILCGSWIASDGDQIALDPHERVNGECPIYYCAHGSGEMTRVAGTFDELLSWWAKGEKVCSATLRR